MFHKRNKLIKRLVQESTAEDVVRSHAYARVAGKHKPVPVRRTPADGGAVSGYRNSMVGSIAQYREKLPPQPTPAEKQAASDAVKGNRPASNAKHDGKATSDPAQRRHHFIEPPKRNFNRFG